MRERGEFWHHEPKRNGRREVNAQAERYEGAEALQWLEKARVMEWKVPGTEHPLTKETRRRIDAAQRALSGGKGDA